MAGRDSGITTVVIGLDAACHTVVEELTDAEIPTLRSLLDDGVSDRLGSQLPPWTPSAWPSLYTGMNPGKHGVFDFLDFDGYDWEIVNATHVRERPLWELLDRHGYSSVVVNGPVTHPPRPFDGALVPGYMAPESPTCHPEGLLDDIESAVGPYRVYPEKSRGAEGYTDAVASRGAAFRYLAERFDPDFGFLQFQATDTVFHDRPDDWETVRRIYRAVDTEIQRTLDACAPENVFVVSDHGIGPLAGVEFRVNEFLSETGHVETVRGGAGMPNWSTVRDTQLKDGVEADTEGSDSALQRVVRAAASVGLTSQRIGGALDRVGLADPIARVVPTGLIHAGTEQVSFADSRAYMRSRTECGIRLNVAGREPEGTIPADAYETVRSDLIEALEAVETPGGDPVFEAVHPREAVFDGPEAERAVDIVTVPSGFEHFLSAEIRGSTFGPPTEPWNHKLNGLIAARGAAVDTEQSLSGAKLFDVAPTVLSTFDVPADERMDGRCLPIVEPAGEATYPRPERGDREVTDDAAVEQRLSDLGYLE